MLKWLKWLGLMQAAYFYSFYRYLHCLPSIRNSIIISLGWSPIPNQIHGRSTTKGSIHSRKSTVPGGEDRPANLNGVDTDCHPDTSTHHRTKPTTQCNANHHTHSPAGAGQTGWDQFPITALYDGITALLPTWPWHYPFGAGKATALPQVPG